MSEIYAPYNFVPLSEFIYFPDTDYIKKRNHDIPLKEGVSGSLDITISSHTQLLLGQEVNGVINSYKLPNGEYAIPGSTLKGMVRNVLEIASFGKIRFVDDKRYGVRDLSAGFYKKPLTSGTQNKGYTPLAKAGWLKFTDDGWVIHPCEYARVEITAIKNCLSPKEWVRISNRPSAEEKYRSWLNTKNKLEIRFDVESFKYHPHQKGKIKLRYRKTSNLETGSDDGTLVFTGQPSPSKHMEFIFYNSSENTKNIDTDVFKGFQHIYLDTDHWKYLKKNQATHFPQGIPVFYLEEGEKITSLGLSQMYKLAYKHSIGETIEHTNIDHRNDDRPDFTELLFGHVDEKDGKKSLKGRVSFSIAKSGKKVNDAKTLEKPTILNSPKPTYYPNYVVQNEDNGKLKGEYKTYMDDSSEIRGWKRYPARPSEQVEIQSINSQQAENQKITVTIKPLIDKMTFQGKVRFHNLSPEELGGLIWGLTWGENDNYRHMIGMGKSFGFGQVCISINEEKSQIIPNDIKLNKSESISKYRKDFELLMKGVYSKNSPTGTSIKSWANSVQLTQLLAMADPTIAPGNLEKLEHMSLNGGGENNQFAKAKKERKVLQKYTDKKSHNNESLGEIWLNKSLTELALENKTTEKVMLKVKALAEAWVEIKDALLKKETLGIIQTLWGEHWDSPVGKSMKKARKIYSETS